MKKLVTFIMLAMATSVFAADAPKADAKPAAKVEKKADVKKADKKAETKKADAKPAAKQ
jgi:hypothetical protein